MSVRTRPVLLGNKMELHECIRQVLEHPEFLQQWDRLRGTLFSKSGIIEKHIDMATGKYEEDAKELFDFISDRIFPHVSETDFGNQRKK